MTRTGKGGKLFQILIADSDRAYRRRLYQLLRREGYSVLQASGGEDVLKVLETSYIDFIILGDNLVDLNVYELMGQLRDTYSDMPLMLLAEKKERDGLRKSYMAGADEYLTKNVDEEELVLRIRAVLRRSGKNYDKRLQVGDVILDCDSLSVTRKGDRQTLPRKEFWLLYKLLSYPDKIFTRTQLMDEIWGLTTETSQSTLNVHVNRLRNKFRKYPEFDLKAVRGIGYKAEVHVD